MVSRFFVPAVAGLLLTAAVAQAQMTTLGGPANYPPAGFTGQQFVDNDGCVFLRAGFGGTVNWVPRVKANRRPLCDLTPSFGPAVAAAVAADMAPDPLAMAPVVMAEPVIANPAAAKPAPAKPVQMAAAPPEMMAPVQPRRSLMDQLFGKPYIGDPIPLVPMPPAPQVVAAPVLAPAPPVVMAQPTYQSALNGADVQCVPGSPRLETVILRSGGTALVCTKGDGSLTGWRSPIFPQGVIGGALTPQMMRGATLATTYAAPRTATNTLPTPPKGYRLAWKDDRLNPLRGIGTAAGQAQQDQVWTRDVPARQVTVAPVQTATSTTVSTMSAPSPRAAYVQVGTYGQPANADGVKARLTALGLPVSTSKITSKGHVLQVVYAGPFASQAQAQAALATTRGAGYSDAILK